MFASRLKFLRTHKKLTQEDIAKKLDVARTTYSGYERGTSEPDLEVLIRIANFFNVSTDYLIGRKDEGVYMNENEKAIYTIMDLSDDSIIDNIPMKYDGIDLTLDEKKEFLAIARAIFDVRRSSRKGQ